MKISAINTKWFERPGFTGNVYIPSEARMGFNALTVTVDGTHPKKKMLDTTRSYYVISGSGIFVIDGETQSASPGDLFVIEPGHVYEYQGEMKLFEFNISPENSFKDQKL